MTSKEIVEMMITVLKKINDYNNTKDTKMTKEAIVEIIVTILKTLDVIKESPRATNQM